MTGTVELTEQARQSEPKQLADRLLAAAEMRLLKAWHLASSPRSRHRLPEAPAGRLHEASLLIRGLRDQLAGSG